MVETYFPIPVEKMGSTPCLLQPRPNGQIVFDRREVPPDIKTVYIVYDLPNGQPPAASLEEALSLCDLALG